MNQSEHETHKSSDNKTNLEIRTIGLNYIWHGLKDSCQFPIVLFVLYGSSTLANKSLHSFAVNFILFLSSYLFTYLVLSPLNKSILDSFPAFATQTMILYKIFWIFPIYITSFFINHKRYKQIASRSFQIFVGKPMQESSSVSQLATGLVKQIHKSLLFAMFLLASSLMSLIPIIGNIISIILLNLLVCFYAFDFGWFNRGWQTSQTVEFFESHWSYFIGFTIPMTTLSIFVPQFINLGIPAFIFPFYIIMANRSLPRPKSDEPKLIVPRIRFFYFADMFSNKVIQYLKVKGSKPETLKNQ
ncbi:etoposide-induced protein 2.4-domain-containing protein [Globomyces pollinis-pini]|nr:etoposide-induced protein 2.4-domain-containing protein [Globomyces pollinis-pini]